MMLTKLFELQKTFESGLWLKSKIFSSFFENCWEHKINKIVGLKYVAEESNCKSSYLFAIKTIEEKFIGVLSVDFTKRKTKLDIESINHLQNHATAIGGVLMTYLQQWLILYLKILLLIS